MEFLRNNKNLILVGVCFFLFSSADSLCNAFLPVYAKSLTPLAFLSADRTAGLPSSIFWLSVGAAQLAAGWWERGRDHRFLLGVAIALSSVGQVAAGASGSLSGLILARMLSGLGMGAVMILVQDDMLRLAGPHARTRASGAYLSLYFAGAIFGAPAGGELAETLGYPAAFAAAAVLSLLALALSRGLPEHRSDAAIERFRPSRLADNRLLIALLLLAAVPSRLIIGAVIYFMAPVELKGLHVSTGKTGVIMTLYPLILAITIPWWSWLTDKKGRPLSFAVAGLLITAGALVAAPLGGKGWEGVALSLALLGLGQAIGLSPQVTVLFRVAEPEIARYGRPAILGAFRLSERVGLFAGPMMGSWLLTDYGADTAALVLTGLVSATTLLFVLTFAVHGRMAR